MGYYIHVDTRLLVPMNTPVYPKKPSKILNIHFHLSPHADDKMKEHLREALQLLATLELAEHDPERCPDVIITDMDTVFDVLRNFTLMSTASNNVWVINPGGKMPELISGSPNPKMRRIDISYVNAAVLGQLTMLVTLYDQECTDTTQVVSSAPVSGEFAAAA